MPTDFPQVLIWMGTWGVSEPVHFDRWNAFSYGDSLFNANLLCEEACGRHMCV